MTARSPFAARFVLPVAALELLVQLAFANRYGYHRDELYFRTAARHPAPGYDDQGPLTPWLGWISESLFGETPRGLRVVSALAVALAVVLVALLARELGAGARGQLVAAGGAAASAFVLAVGHLLSTSTFDLLVWTATLVVVARILGGGDDRLWLVAGVVVGIGLENKQLPILLVLALAVGLAIDRRLLGLLRSPWIWAGMAVALAIWLPYLVWQGVHGWPQLELAEDIRADEAGESRATLVPLQLLLLGPFIVPVVAVGLWALVRDPSLRPWRSLGFAYVVLLVLLFATGGKPYYAAPFLLGLLAAGAVPVERWLTTRGRQVLVAAAVVVTGVLSMIVALPVAPGGRARVDADRRPQRGRDRDGRLAGARADGGWSLRGPDRGAAVECGRLHGELRRSRSGGPLRAGARASACVLRAQRLRTVRSPAGFGRPGDRPRLPRPLAGLRGLQARGDGRQRDRSRERGAGRDRLRVRAPSRAVVGDVAGAAPPGRLSA